jgi:hypothetical protein
MLVAMKRERLIKSVSGIVAVLLGVFLLTGETFGTGSAGPVTTSKPENQSRQTSKPASKPVIRATGGPSSFTPNMTFGEAIDILRNSTKPRLNIAVLWKDLEENADIYRETPIGMDGLSKVPLRTHLKVLLMSVSGGSVEKLGYVVDDGVIIIATQSSLPRRMKARVYDIADLVAEPANYRLMPGFGGGFNFGGRPYGGMMANRGMGYGGRGFYGGAGLNGLTGLRTIVGGISTGRGFNTNPYATARPRRYRGR